MPDDLICDRRLWLSSVIYICDCHLWSAFVIGVCDQGLWLSSVIRVCDYCLWSAFSGQNARSVFNDRCLSRSWSSAAASISRDYPILFPMQHLDHITDDFRPFCLFQVTYRQLYFVQSRLWSHIAFSDTISPTYTNQDAQGHSSTSQSSNVHIQRQFDFLTHRNATSRPIVKSIMIEDFDLVHCETQRTIK
jgi:hypothetical protein